MDNQEKCNKYEAFFIFQNKEAFDNHIETCEDCYNEHQKYLKVSQLVKEVAPVYLEREKSRKKQSVTLKKFACCFILFLCFTTFSGVKIYDNYNFQVNSIEDSYISDMGLPIDEYGFLEI